MVKSIVSIYLEGDLLKKVDDFKKASYPDLSRSAVVTLILRDFFKGRDISVVK